MKSQGFGCMGLSAFYTSAKTVTPDSAKAVIHRAVQAGVTLFNTATFYGPLNEAGYGANLRLLRTALEGIDRSKIQLMVKICMDTRCPTERTGSSWVLRANPEDIRADVDFALEQLGTDYIDIIVLCRVPKDISIEEVVLGMKAVVDTGKARHIGLSEASAATIRKAHAVHPLHCIEQEWSLWARDIEADIVPTCRELGIKIVAYSPLGRGVLTGTIEGRHDSKLDPSDYRLHMPKLNEENAAANLKLVEDVKAVARRKGCSLGCLALSWLHSKGPDVIPIPGTSNPDHLDDNYSALNIELSPEEVEEIESIFRVDASPGWRYPGNHNTFHEN